jgi:signal transduction histidine kinase
VKPQRQHPLDTAYAAVLRFCNVSSIQRSRVILALLLAVAFVPASALVYLQYRSLSQIQDQMHQALFANLRQALLGARIEAQNEILGWYRRALVGPEIHQFLRDRDLQKIEYVAATARRICPQLGIFFGYRLRPGQEPEVFVFRPGRNTGALQTRMDLSAQDPVEPAIRAMIAAIPETRSHTFRRFQDFDGERQQVFLHLVDDDPDVPKTPQHKNKIGYYGIAVPARALATEYFPKLLHKHLARIDASRGEIPGNEAVGAVFNESNLQVSTSNPGLKSTFPVRERVIEEPKDILEGWTMGAGFPIGALDSSDRTRFARGLALVLVISVLLFAAIVTLGITTAREMEFSRAKTEFVASVSHELKTPLSLIRGFVETLRLNRLGAPSQREEYFGIIDTEILRLSNMIDRILEMSKIEVGLKQYQPETVDVANLIDDTLAAFSNELDRESFLLERRIEEPLPLAQIDPHAFSQALLNLLSNAVKYSGTDRRILVQAARRNGHLEVSVTDHGIGISKREQTRIFDRFYRAGNTASRIAGAGLGLALVKHFANAHGGDVTVSSSSGNGSCFAILLPYVN